MTDEDIRTSEKNNQPPPAEPRPRRRRGGQAGNTNRPLHGFYSDQFTREERARQALGGDATEALNRVVHQALDELSLELGVALQT